MKTFIPFRTLCVCLSFFFSFSLFATVHTVNNQNPNPGQFTNVTLAIAAANPGDTILVNGSTTAYPSFTINKDSLTFFGAGYLPQSEQGAGTTINSTIQFFNVKHIKVVGFTLLANFSTNGTHNDFITIEHCRASYLSLNGSPNDWVIRNCNFFSLNANINIPNGTGSYNFIIAFNVFDGYLSGGGDDATGVLIKNNLFLSHNVPYCLNDMEFAILENNIFHSKYTTASSSVLNCTFNNNLTDPDSTSSSHTNILPPPGNGGSNNLERMDPMFVQGVPASIGSQAWWIPAGRNYRLQGASPGAGMGTDGGDLGIYGGHASSGGVNLFSETMEPPHLPVVESLDIISSTVPSGGTLNVNLTLRNRVTEVD